MPPWIYSGGDFGEIGFDVPINDHLKLTLSKLQELHARFPMRSAPSRP